MTLRDPTNEAVDDKRTKTHTHTHTHTHTQTSNLKNKISCVCVCVPRMIFVKEQGRQIRCRFVPWPATAAAPKVLWESTLPLLKISWVPCKPASGWEKKNTRTRIQSYKIFGRRFCLVDGLFQRDEVSCSRSYMASRIRCCGRSSCNELKRKAMSLMTSFTKLCVDVL